MARVSIEQVNTTRSRTKLDLFIDQHMSMPFLRSWKLIKTWFSLYLNHFLFLTEIAKERDIVEIKPKTMLANPDVQCKAAGCRAFIKVQKMKATYKFVTEEDIFINNQEYLDLLARI